MTEKNQIGIGWRISIVAAAGVALLYIIMLDNVSSIWQYSVAMICLVYVLFALVINWDKFLRRYEDDSEITDIWEYKNRW